MFDGKAGLEFVFGTSLTLNISESVTISLTQQTSNTLTLWLGRLIFLVTSCGLGGKHDDYDSADKTSPQQRFHGYYSECYSNRRQCSDPRPSVPTCLLPSGMPGGLAVGQLSTLVGHVCRSIRELKRMEQSLRWLASRDGSTTSLW